ncbi:hypothetical protein D3C75_1259210 [compost metagenome]
MQVREKVLSLPGSLLSKEFQEASADLLIHPSQFLMAVRRLGHHPCSGIQNIQLVEGEIVPRLRDLSCGI